MSLHLVQHICESRQFCWKQLFLLDRSQNIYRTHSVIVLSSWCHATQICFLFGL
jgi:hypothetical protein